MRVYFVVIFNKTTFLFTFVEFFFRHQVHKDVLPRCRIHSFLTTTFFERTLRLKLSQMLRTCKERTQPKT